MNDINPILPPGCQWIEPPNLMIGEFRGFLATNEVNVWYTETKGWGRIELKDFIPGELEKLEPECKIERYCGNTVGPEGKKFTIRARKAPWFFQPMAKPTIKTKNQTVYHVIWLRTGQCVTGFSYPPIIHTQQNENGSPCRPRVNEIPVAECCYAVLGNERPYKFDNQEAAKHIASIIPGAKVELWED